MASTGVRSAARYRPAFIVVLALCAGLVVSACSGSMDMNEESGPTPTIGSTSDPALPTRLPVVETQTALAGEVPYVIERVVLATEVDDDGAPENEVSVLSQEQQNVYLTIRIRDLPADTVFQAVWQENDEVIGQSEVVVEDAEDGAQWVALPFRSIAALNPAAMHSVDLIIDERHVNSFAFRVGVGDASDVIAEATFARGVDDQGQPVSPDDEFDRFAEQIVMFARISNMVDPTGMIFTAHWKRGTVPLAQGPPDGGQPTLNGEPNERLMTFTLVPQSSLVPGDYSVELRLNGQSIGSYDFVIETDDAVNQEEESEPPPTPEPTPTPVDPVAEVRNVVIATEIDEDSNEPEAEVEEVEGYPTEAIELFVAMEFEGLEIDERVEVTIGIGNSIISRHEMPAAALEDGWMSTQLEFRAPDIDGRSVTYEITIYIDGARAGGTTLDVLATGEAPPPTPTPDPFDLSNEDEDDEDND